MKKIKLLVAAFSAITGIGGAVASNVQASSPSMIHDWVDMNNVTILINQTTIQAQVLCTGGQLICLKAKDNVYITTRGNLK
jgi:hypothetical protein